MLTVHAIPAGATGPQTLTGQTRIEAFIYAFRILNEILTIGVFTWYSQNVLQDER
jgi:hypothetical protein